MVCLVNILGAPPLGSGQHANFKLARIDPLHLVRLFGTAKLTAPMRGDCSMVVCRDPLRLRLLLGSRSGRERVKKCYVNAPVPDDHSHSPQPKSSHPNGGMPPGPITRSSRGSLVCLGPTRPCGSAYVDAGGESFLTRYGLPIELATIIRNANRANYGNRQLSLPIPLRL